MAHLTVLNMMMVGNLDKVSPVVSNAVLVHSSGAHNLINALNAYLMLKIIFY
jgi:hypothetical protein